jgi:hypothetical protein
VNSLVGLLTSQPTLAEALPSLGHLPKVIQTLSGCVDRNHSQAAVGAVKVLLQLSKSQVNLISKEINKLLIILLFFLFRHV